VGAVSPELLDERDSERERLARAGGRFREYVTPLEDIGDHVTLDL
jgi:hypothetical protein